MTGRWLRRSRDRRDDESLRNSQALLTSAFLDMDAKQSATESAVQTASQLSPQRRLSEQWEPIRNACYAAAEAYLAAIDESGTPANPATVDSARNQLDSAVRAVDDFWARNRSALESASSTAGAITHAAQAAETQVMQARRKLADAEPIYRAFPSVARCGSQLDSLHQSLTSAIAAENIAMVRDAATGVTEAVAMLEAALVAAPGREDQARRALASVKTRIQAVRTRAEAVAPNLSALFREFNEQSSADLTDNERQGQRRLAQASALLDEAAAAQRNKHPEAALDLLSRARTEVAAAEELVDQVAVRLRALRELRGDHTMKEKEVRFRLRDAQRLAVTSGQADEWGSVLDAQVPRIDRIVGELTGRHPDYWAYDKALDDVSTFIATVVTRIRQSSAR